MHPKIYQDYLTDRSKAAMRTKAEQGIFPSCAPLGYKNVEHNGQKTIALDPETAPRVKRLFELATKKKMSLRKLGVEAEKMGLRSRNGKALSAPAIRIILTNSFYVGLLRFDGKLSQGTHSPIVSQRMFDEVADVLRSRGKNTKKKPD